VKGVGLAGHLGEENFWLILLSNSGMGLLHAHSNVKNKLSFFDCAMELIISFVCS
jgi:hypothetical protein